MTSGGGGVCILVHECNRGMRVIGSRVLLRVQATDGESRLCLVQREEESGETNPLLYADFSAIIPIFAGFIRGIWRGQTDQILGNRGQLRAP